MRSHLACLFLALALLATSACGGDDDSAERAADARMKCDRLATVVCERALYCKLGSGTVSGCKAAWATKVDCEAAVDVAPEYERCVPQLQALECSVLGAGGELNLPASCTKVITIPEGRLPDKK